MTRILPKSLLGIVAAGAIALGANSARADPVTNIEMTVTNNATVEWIWSTNYLVQATTENPARGSIVGGELSTKVEVGNDIVVEAAPSYGRHFKAWVGDVTPGYESNNPLTQTVNSALSLTATFEDNNYVITRISPYGSLSGPTNASYGATIQESVGPTNIDLGAGKEVFLKTHRVSGNSHSDL